MRRYCRYPKQQAPFLIKEETCCDTKYYGYFFPALVFMTMSITMAVAFMAVTVGMRMATSLVVVSMAMRTDMSVRRVSDS